MKQWRAFVWVFVLTAAIGVDSPARASVFVNEIHYDNGGTDESEGIEIAGNAGTDLTGWSIDLYNGSNGAVYNTIPLTGILPDQQHGFGTLNFLIPGIQNGPDGMALVDSADTVVQFLSYEGPFEATSGSAAGLMSDDIGVLETVDTPVGYSLQLTGNGLQYEDFSWMQDSIAQTRGDINIGQNFVPIPGAVWLLSSSLLGMGAFRRRKA